MKKAIVSLILAVFSISSYSIDNNNYYLTYSTNATEFNQGDKLNLTIRSNLDCVDIMFGQINLHKQCSFPFDFMIIPSDYTKGESGVVTIKMIGYDSQFTTEKSDSFDIKINN